MRRFFVCATLLALAVTSGPSAQEPQPRFRSRVDLLTIDVTAVDGRGRPVEDLRPRDFTVKVDGKVRAVVSAELVKVDRAKAAASTRPIDALISTNVSPQNARRINVAVDQTLITPGMITPLLRTASQFIDRLAPSDYAAFVTFPDPGPRVDFTTDKSAVRKAMQSIVGQPAKMLNSKFGITLWEAFEISGRESVESRSTVDPPGPTMQRVIDRGCGGLEGVDLLMCRLAILNEASTVAADARLEANISLHALEALMEDLTALEGPKSMVVFSAGLVNEDPTVFDKVRRLAAAARTTINVVAVERDRVPEVRGEPTDQAQMPLRDRAFELQGLEEIADQTNGTLFRGIASGAGIFERLESELSAWYLVAVERQPGDPDQQRVEVDVKRKGVAVRSNKTVVTGVAHTRRPLDELLNDALSSPFTLSGIPVRVATFTQRDAGDNYRLRVAAEIGQPDEAAAEFALGYILADERGRALTTAGSRRTLTRPAAANGQGLPYETSLSLPPGSYTLRFGVVDQDGRRGTVVHRVVLPPLDGDEIGSSDLAVGTLPGEGETLRPSVEPVVTNELAAYLELYLTDADRERVSVTLEIAEGEASPALATETLTLRPGEQPGWRVASGAVDATMAPGRYIARAAIRRDGVTVRTLSRLFTLVHDASIASRVAPRKPAVAVAVSPDLQRRTAAYVSGVVGGLSNIVAQEEFVFSRSRRVTSDLLLVRYPGTQRDLIPYRDVSRLNGAVVPGREQRLLELFVNPPDRLRERAREIMLSAEAWVPTAFNPVFVLGFLQADYQSRFEMTVIDAGPGWPREVKAVAFVETARPTLLRAGPFGDLDVPARGTAWIEEGTGRVLQTELQIGSGRGAPRMITKFTVDDRLQVTVPIEMRTQNPDGVATYSNFRRFGVETNTVIPVPTVETTPNPNRR